MSHAFTPACEARVGCGNSDEDWNGEFDFMELLGCSLITQKLRLGRWCDSDLHFSCIPILLQVRDSVQDKFTLPPEGKRCSLQF